MVGRCTLIGLFLNVITNGERNMLIILSEIGQLRCFFLFFFIRGRFHFEGKVEIFSPVSKICLPPCKNILPLGHDRQERGRIS